MNKYCFKTINVKNQMSYDQKTSQSQIREGHKIISQTNKYFYIKQLNKTKKCNIHRS